MGHYSEFYEADENAKAREKRLAATKTLANDVKELNNKLREIQQRLERAGYHRLAWESLQEIVDDLKAHQPQEGARDLSYQINNAIMSIETAILWLRKADD